MTRSLNVLFQNGLLLNLTLPPTELSEKDSAKEFVDAIVKYKSGIEGFRSRKPDLSIGKQMKLVSSIDDTIHTIINARKYIDIPVAADVYGEQVFTLNFISNSMSINCVKTKDTILSMYFDTMFDNWIDIAFPAEESSEVVTLPELEPEIELESEPESESELHPNTEQMKAELSAGMFEFWDYCVNVRGMTEKITIEYSGAGDSGGTDDVISIYDLGKDTDFDEKLWHMIQAYEGGFYNNEGGYGNITVSAYLFEWEHNNYIHETDTTIMVSASLAKSEEPEPEEEDEEPFEHEEEVEIEEDDEDEEYFDEIEADDHRHFKDED